MSATYRIFLRKEEVGGYSGHCIEYPEAIGQGDTEEEAIEDIKKAIELWLEHLSEQKESGLQKVVSVTI